MDGPNKNNKGSRLFLPKIEYTRLENSAKWATESCDKIEQEELDYRNTLEEANNEEKLQKNKRSVGLSEKLPNSGTSASFTKFSVLPPIRDHGSTREKFYKQLDKTLIEDKHDLDFRRRGSVLRRQPALFCAERGDGGTKINTNHLKIVGQKFQPSILVKSNNEPLIARRPYSTPQNSTQAVRDRSEDRLQQRTQRFTKFKRFNSETLHENNSIPRKATSLDSEHVALLKPLDICKKVSLSLDNPYNRPVSRCHIDINVNETKNNKDLKEAEKLSSVGNNKNTQDVVESDSDLSAPTVQISNEDEENTKPSSIQILIDTLETAKHEIPEKLELPQMSVRDQRRRSALCRVNSKQVDDFLLVHNLKDLGLL